MIFQIGDNIISSLGFTTEENYQAIKSGAVGLRYYDSYMNGVEPFVASLIDRDRLNERFFSICPAPNSHTDIEKASILSVTTAIEEAQIDVASPRVLFLFSTTKGNVHLLENNNCEISDNQAHLWHSAQKIVEYFNNPNTPIIVSNACISGASAQIAAMRELESGMYDYAVVIGADMLSRFIVSGFQSFKALSEENCRPFDVARKGLNLGETASSIIYSAKQKNKSQIALRKGAICNDANHISGPSPIGEGSFRALQNVMQDVKNEDIAFINAHGTATPYNDAMESIAITRAGLESVPVNSLKAYFGHTLGGAGVLESIISMHALLDDTVLPTAGFENKESECSLNIVKQIGTTKKPFCLKMLSGFGGCNAALLFERGQFDSLLEKTTKPEEKRLFIKKHIHLNLPSGDVEKKDFLSSVYRSLKIDYPKFFKMDNLSKLGFLASELILKEEKLQYSNNENLAVICFNRSSSLESDILFQTTIQDPENYFPSPAFFVYTLPNIVTGEIAIRNKFYGETSFYISESLNSAQLFQTVNNAFQNKITDAVLVAWIESLGEKEEAFMMLVEKEPSDILFSIEQINILYSNNK